MAAHPFGPIEKFLITAYKELPKDLRNAKVVLGHKRTFKCPTVEEDLFWGFYPFEPIIEPTANVNSSDYKVCEAPCSSDKYFRAKCVLSRGLGYRITFTMPADRQPSLNSEETCPEIKIHILDFFEDKILKTFESLPPSQTTLTDTERR